MRNSQKVAKEFLYKYHSIRKRNSISATFEKISDRLRLPDRYISFSPLIFNYHKELEKLPGHYPVNYIGIPSFDHFVKWKSLSSCGENILFVDQPWFEQKLLGWTMKYKSDFLKELTTVAHSLNKKLYIKPHPWNDRSLYEVIQDKIIVFEDNWETVIPDINIVLGFSSTLLMPFIAMDHVTCFTLEIHPQKSEAEYSNFLVKSNACHPVRGFEDLRIKIMNRNLWHQTQKENKNYFIENWMYKFDGKSSERLRKVLIEDEAV